MRTALNIAIVSSLLFLTVPVAAEHDAGECTPTASDATVEVPGVLGVFLDGEAPDIEGLWIYQESNDLEGWQRNDSTSTADENCGHGADTIIF